jgi:hypothetical protein
MIFDLEYRADLGGFVTDTTVAGLNLPTVFPSRRTGASSLSD